MHITYAQLMCIFSKSFEVSDVPLDGCSLALCSVRVSVVSDSIHSFIHIRLLYKISIIQQL